MYQVLYKDIPVFDFNPKNGEVIIYNDKYMPFDIYMEMADDFDTRYQNNVNFNVWCSERILPLDREYIKEILNFYGFPQTVSDAERSKISIACRCMSLNDCFWVKDTTETITWKDVNLFKNSLKNGVFEIALFGSSLSITNKELSASDLTTGGKAPKAWQRVENDFFLLKGDKNDSVIKETEASQILRELGFDNIEYTKIKFNNQYVSKNKCVTDENINLVKAHWFEIWCMNHDQSIVDYIELYKTDFDKMNLADYLIGNNDEHPLNWGFLYDNNMNIIALSPHMDFDHAFESTMATECMPARYLGLNKTQFAIALDIVKRHPDWLKDDIDLSKYKYGSYVKERIDSLKKELSFDKKPDDLDDDNSDDFGLS